MKNINRFLICFFLCMLAVSCSNLFINDSELSSADNSINESSESKKTYSLKGTLSISGAVPDVLKMEESVSSSRSAIPYISGTDWNNYYWQIDATYNGETKSINSKTNSERFTTSTNPSYVEFIFENLEEGSWNFTAELKKLASVSASPATTDASIMKDTYSDAVIGGMTPIISHTFLLKPKTSETGKGSIKLPMTIDSSVKQITATSTTTGWTNTTLQPTTTSSTLELSNVPSKTYEVTLNFYNATGTNAILLYTTVQTINVFDNMETNTWLNDGTSVFTGTTSATFNLTNTIISQFAKTTFYVGVPSGLTGITASDNTGTGSPYAPLESVTKAAQIIASTGVSTNDYRIFVCGEITGTQKIENITTDHAKSVTIKGYSTDGNNPDKLKGGTSGSVLLVDSAVPVTITNLKITGGKGTSSLISTNTSKLCGGGINVKSGSVILSTNTWITGNYAEYGGGVYVASGAKLFMSANSVVGDPITNETTTASALNYSTFANCANYATAYGGGIYVNGGELYIGYSNASTLDADFTGGVNRNACPTNTIPQDAWGGGIYYKGPCFKMAKGTVSYNYAKMSGGGITINEENTVFDFSGGSIEKNTAGRNGGGLYLNSAKVYMNGTAIIGDTGTTMTQATDFSNKVTSTDAFGGGFYMEGTSAKLYLGYKTPATEGGDPVADDSFTGGICHNYSAKYAGGLSHNGNQVSINKGNISYNKAEASGGGAYLSGSLTMTGGNFTSNTCGSDGNGGALYCSAGTFNLSGGTFTSNTCGSNGNGGAVYYSYGIFNYSGSLSFPSGSSKNNDIYITNSKKITIAGTSLSGSAKITPSAWTRGTQIIDGGTNVTDTTLSQFSLTDSDWSIEKSGSNSSPIGIINADIYVSASGNDSNSGVSSSKAFKTIAAAAKACKSCKTEIKVVGTFTASSASDLQSIPNSDDITVSSITLTGTGSGATINANSKGSALTINKAILVNIENITLKGGNSTNGAGLNVAVSGARVNLGNNVFIKENKASGYGGGVYVASGAKLCLNGSAVIGNSGGNLPANTSVEPSSSNGINKANLGGGIYCEGTLGIGKSVNSSGNLSNSAFTGGIYTNVSTEYGGGIYLTSSSTLSTNGNFNIVKNRAGSGGGGIYYASTGALSLSSGTFTSNVAGAGGAILIPNGNNIAITLSGGSYTSNSTTTGAGGAINSWSTGLLKLEGSVSFSDNTGSTSSGGGALSHNGNYEFKSTDIHILYGGSIGSNDVWLYPGKYIKLEAGLYYHDSNNPIGINATTVNTQVLGGSNLTSSMIEKFVIVDDAYALDSEGYLREAITSVTMDDVTSMEWISDQWGDMTHDGSNFSVNDLSDIEGQVIICKIDRDEVWAALCFSNVTEDGFRLDVKVYDDSHEEPYVYGDDYEYSEVMDEGCCIDLSYGSLSVWADPGDGTSNFYIYDDHSFSTHLGFDTGEVGWLVLD